MVYLEAPGEVSFLWLWKGVLVATNDSFKYFFGVVDSDEGFLLS